MDVRDVLDILESVPSALHTRLDTQQFVSGAMQLRFRGGEWGRFCSRLQGELYTGERGYTAPRVTYYGFTLGEAISYALRRTAQETKRGRFYSSSGELVSQFRFGFPYIIGIDITGYEVRETGQPGEMQLIGSLQRKDMVVLFSPKIDLLERVCCGDGLYIKLLARQLAADR